MQNLLFFWILRENILHSNAAANYNTLLHWTLMMMQMVTWSYKTFSIHFARNCVSRNDCSLRMIFSDPDPNYCSSSSSYRSFLDSELMNFLFSPLIKLKFSKMPHKRPSSPWAIIVPITACYAFSIFNYGCMGRPRVVGTCKNVVLS